MIGKENQLTIEIHLHTSSSFYFLHKVLEK